MAAVFDAIVTEPLPLVVPHPPTVLHIPDFLDVLVEEEAEDVAARRLLHASLPIRP
jgi:hypothetical protein